MSAFDAIARLFRMSDESWRRHANPWSVYTRFAAIPALILAIWSRVWFRWWALVPVALVVVWLLINPHVFPPVAPHRSWVSKGIYGERLWVRGENLPLHAQTALRWIAIPGLSGLALLAWGLIMLSPWPTFFGAMLIILAQLWRIDRLGLLYDEMAHGRLPPEPARHTAPDTRSSDDVA